MVWLVWDLVGRVWLLLGSGRSVWVAWFAVLDCGVVDCLCGFGWGFGLIGLGVGFGVLCVACYFWRLLVFVLVLGAFVARQFCTWLLVLGFAFLVDLWELSFGVVWVWLVYVLDFPVGLLVLILVVRFLFCIVMVVLVWFWFCSLCRCCLVLCL